MQGGMTLPGVGARASTDFDFRTGMYQCHHIGGSSFLFLSINMVKTFPL